MTIIYTILSLMFLSMVFMCYQMVTAPIMDDNGNILDKDGNIINKKGKVIVKKEDRNMNQ